MAFLFDSSLTLLLFAACVGAWLLTSAARASSRINIRFAAMLFTALAAARLLGMMMLAYVVLTPVVALLAASLGTTALALGLLAIVARPIPPLAASLALVLALGAGLASALSGEPVYALGCQMLGASLAMAAALGRFSGGTRRTALSLMAMVSLICGGLALLGGALNAVLLFFAAGLIAAAHVSQPGVEAGGQQHRFPVVSRTG